MILAIGNSGVYEVAAFNAVLEELKFLGHQAVLYKQDKCLEGEEIFFKNMNGRFICGIVIDGNSYDVNDFSAIWYLRPHLPRSLLNFEPAKYRQFIRKQFLVTHSALWSVFRDRKWVNDPWMQLMAEDKPLQLKLAIEAGFKIPETLITSDPLKAQKFYDQNNGNVVVKALSPSPMLDEVLYTNKIKQEDLGKISSLRLSPAIFQEYVAKEYELRITVVGERIFPVKIFSQEDEATSLDWRKKPKFNDFEVRMEIASLPPDIQNKISRFMNLLGLRYGCIDMIVAKGGEYIFLEINPNGQWYFVQVKTEYLIARAIAKLLT